jgi:type I restriction enzyme S subunit
MSKLDELLRELCPNGVEYKTLGEIAVDIYRGAGITRDQVTAEGTPCVRYGEIYTTYGVWFDKCVSHTDESKLLSKKYFEHGDILFAITGESVDDIAKCCVYIGHEKCLAGGDIVVLKHNQNPKYLSYALATTDARQQKSKGKVKSKVVHSSVPAIREIKVPVPPIEIQREIVRILDNFTNLTAELTAELTARGIQYSYYRNKLLTFHSDTKIVQLADIADIGTGSSNTNEAVEDGKYPFFVRSQEPLRKNDYEYDETAIITAGDGVGVGKVYHYIEGKYALHQRAYRIHINTPEVMPKYYFHYMKAKFLPYIQKTMFQGSVASIRRPMLNAFPVPVPPLDVQNRIVNVLDNFEKICSDLNIGLPAEIEARQKQYEYYRDKLLTFAENGNTILSRAEQSRAEQSRAEQSRALIKLVQYAYGCVWLELGDVIVSLNTGLNPRKFFKLNTEDATNYYITIREMKDGKVVPSEKTDRMNDEARKLCNNRSNLEVGDVLFSGTGTIGETAVIEKEPSNWNIKEGVYAIKPNQTMIKPMYLRYILMTDFIKKEYMKKAAGGTVQSVPMGELKKIRIPVPSLQEQNRIVGVLKQLDDLCNDLTSGLPAEIEARQKQYEYYRDKLLTFKEVAAT